MSVTDSLDSLLFAASRACITPFATFVQIQDGKPVANALMVGGETEALQRVKKFAAECQAQPHKGSKDGNDSIYGTNFSCKISPWLTTGSLSPQSMFEELKKTASRTISASSKGKDDGDGMSWLTSELLWRDFFSLIPLLRLLALALLLNLEILLVERRTLVFSGDLTGH